MVPPKFFDFDLSNLNTSENWIDIPTIKPLNDGGFLVAGTVKSNTTYATAAGLFNADGSTRVPFFEVSPNTLGRQIFNNTAVLPNGNIVLAWHSTYDGRLPNKFQAYGAVSSVLTPRGEVLSETFHGYGREPSVTGMADNSYAMVWWASERWAPYDDGDGHGVFGQIVNADGTIATPRAQINVTAVGDQNFPNVTALDNGNLVVSWEESDYSDTIFGEHYTYGIVLGEDFKAVTPERKLFNLAPYANSDTDLEPLPDGGFIAANSNGVRIFNADATLRSDLPDIFPVGTQSPARVAVLDTGGFVVVWSSTSFNETAISNRNTSILGQRFDAQGTADGNIFRVDLSPSEQQNNPDVAVLSNGSIVVTWHDETENPSHGRIIAAGEMIAGPQNDIVRGTAANDHLFGWSGDDLIIGSTGHDTLEGGGGADLIGADVGDDVLVLLGETLHGAGLEALNVSSTTQIGTQARVSVEYMTKIEAVSHAGSGIDTIRLADSDDAFFLHDAFSGFHANALLTADSTGRASTARFAAVERIEAMGGSDLIDLTSPDYSLAGVQMHIDGGDGDDVIWGSDANEKIIGGSGNDTLFGGTGSNVLTGGSGADVFEFTRSSTNTVITDFSVAEGDSLRFYNAGNAVFDVTTAALTGTTMTIGYTDIIANSVRQLSVDFEATAGDILSALEII